MQVGSLPGARNCLPVAHRLEWFPLGVCRCAMPISGLWSNPIVATVAADAKCPRRLWNIFSGTTVLPLNVFKQFSNDWVHLSVSHAVMATDALGCRNWAFTHKWQLGNSKGDSSLYEKGESRPTCQGPMNAILACLCQGMWDSDSGRQEKTMHWLILYHSKVRYQAGSQFVSHWRLTSNITDW